ncbi:MAG: peptidyl-prolyl cis-trans isomerase [Myxococcales bacterium]|nr:peptidyl-prolyl cis-trans isomerase [Myxococcales bacterium]
MRGFGRWLPVGLWALSCGVSEPGVPPGKLAVVGPTVLGPEDLLGVQTQLGPYAQLRFGGPEGGMALLESLVAAELLAQQAVDEGLGDDPRVALAILEEEAALSLAAELERRVPRAEVAADGAALRAWYDAHPDAFWTPERRNLEGVVMPTHEQAEAALGRLAAGEVALSELGEQYATGLQARDDDEHPGFHSILFDPALAPGDWLSAPVVVGRSLLVGRVQQIVPAERRPFDDPAVQEQLVQAVRAPRLDRARDALLAELAERYPERDP